MTQRVIPLKSQSFQILSHTGLQPGVTAVCVGLKLIHAAESLIERLPERKWRKTSTTDCLVTVQLHLIRLMQPARAHVIHAYRAALARVLLDSKVILVVIRRLQLAA